MSTYSVDHRQREGGMGWKVLAVFAGFLVPIVMIIGLWLAISAHNASNSAAKAAAGVPSAPSYGRTGCRSRCDSELCRHRAGRRGRHRHEARRIPGHAARRSGRAGRAHQSLDGRSCRHDRAGDQLPRLDVRQDCTRAGDPCSCRSAGRRDADEQRHHAALARLPRCGDRTEPRVLGHHARRVEEVQLGREGARRVHVPLWHRPGVRAHRQRDVRRDHRRAEEHAAGAEGVRPRLERVVPQRPRRCELPRTST